MEGLLARFESNQWIRNKRFDPSRRLIEPRIWIYAGINIQYSDNILKLNVKAYINKNTTLDFLSQPNNQLNEITAKQIQHLTFNNN